MKARESKKKKVKVSHIDPLIVGKTAGKSLVLIQSDILDFRGLCCM